MADGSISHRPRAFDAVVLTALEVLADARRSMREAKRKLADANLSEASRNALRNAHDGFARKVTAARFDLDAALDASEDG